MSSGHKERENYILLLLGSAKNSLPTELHAQKELFILSKVNPKVDSYFKFEKHYQGPFSQVLSQQINEPKYYADAYTNDPSGFRLTDQGKKEFESMTRSLESHHDFLLLRHAMELIRNIYDKLTKDQLLFLIYLSFPEYVKKSAEYDRIMEKSKQIIGDLYVKNIITEERQIELLKKIQKWMLDNDREE